MHPYNHNNAPSRRCRLHGTLAGEVPKWQEADNIIQTAPKTATAIAFAWTAVHRNKFLISPTEHFVPGGNFFLHSFESLECLQYYLFIVLRSYSCTYAYKSTKYVSTYYFAECFFESISFPIQVFSSFITIYSSPKVYLIAGRDDQTVQLACFQFPAIEVIGSHHSYYKVRPLYWPSFYYVDFLYTYMIKYSNEFLQQSPPATPFSKDLHALCVAKQHA